MFPGLRQRFDTALDLIVEFSTLGEYRLAAPAAGGPASAPVAAVAEAAGSAGCAPMSQQGPRMGGAGGYAARSADQQVVGGAAATARGAAVRAPLRGAAATPAARRLAGARTAAEPGSPQGFVAVAASSAPTAAASPHRVRGGAPAVPEQLCLAV